jgi:hypothetical protein
MHVLQLRGAERRGATIISSPENLSGDDWIIALEPFSVKAT